MSNGLTQDRTLDIEESGMALTTDRPLTCSVPEAGKILGISRWAAYQAAANGQLPVIRIGRLVRVPLAALDRMVEPAGGKVPKAAANAEVA
jgi:excisionase family DNA binding protein